jgi:hypothetical protein
VTEAVETFICREDAERFIEEVRGDEPQLAKLLRINFQTVRLEQCGYT